MIATRGSRDATARSVRRARAGFTLTEIMIALGVLVVGMGMAAGALHAGIQSHINTVDDIIRTLIGENAIAIAKARLRHTTDNGITADFSPLSGTIGVEDMKYPVARASGRGFVLFAKRAQSDQTQNDYGFLVIPSEVKKKGNYASTDLVPRATVSDTSSGPEGVSKIVARGRGDIDKLPVGAKIVFVDKQSGEVLLPLATVATLVGRSAVELDRKIPTGTWDLTVLVSRTYVKSNPSRSSDPIDTTDPPEVTKPYKARTALPR